MGIDQLLVVAGGDRFHVGDLADGRDIHHQAEDAQVQIFRDSIAAIGVGRDVVGLLLQSAKAVVITLAQELSEGLFVLGADGVHVATSAGPFGMLFDFLDAGLGGRILR